MKNRLFKALLSACMLFTIQAQAIGNIHAAESNVIPDGTYTVPTAMMNATSINNPSMAAGALGNTGTLEVKDGKWSLEIEFKTLDFGGQGTIFGNASDIKYYEGDSASGTPKDAEIVSYRNDAKVTQMGGAVLENQKAVSKVKMPIAANSKGVYINMYVDFMKSNPDAYIAFDLKTGVQNALQDLISKAKGYAAKDYTAASFSALQTAIQKAEAAIVAKDDENALTIQMETLQKAINALVNNKAYDLADGTYSVSSTVLKADNDEPSMAASAIKNAVVTAKGNVLRVQLDMLPVSVGSQTAYVDKVEYETAPGVYKAAEIVAKDDAGHVKQVALTLAKNTKLTNVKFYYGGSPNGAAARLSLGLDTPTAITASKFATDGTYTVNVALWNASKDVPSMAASIFTGQASIVVKDGKPMMYIETKKMTLGTITAYLQEMKVGSGEEQATVVSKDAQGNPTMFAFALPNEDEFIPVQVNPHVAIMGNTYIEARIKVDYSSLKKISDDVKAPALPDINPTPTDDKTTGTNNPTNAKTDPKNSAVGNPAVHKPAAKIVTKGSVQTSDNTNLGVLITALLSSMGAMFALIKKRV